MKISISLSDGDVQFLDQYAEQHGCISRSAVVHTAVRMLRSTELGYAYADAWAQWENSGEADIWGRTTSDDLT